MLSTENFKVKLSTTDVVRQRCGKLLQMQVVSLEMCFFPPQKQSQLY